jgi:hypothetical protein
VGSFKRSLIISRGKHSLDEFLDDVPTISREQAIAVLEQARELVVSGARAA